MLENEKKLKESNFQNLINFRTDLASERRDIYQKANKLEEIDGIQTTKEEINENIKVERVQITNTNGEQAIGKPMGNYITIDVKKLKIAGEDEIQKASEVVTNELRSLIDKHIQKQDEILVVGLGNVYVTPDALGPKVINEIDVTRHLINYLPQYVEEGTRPVCAVAPGVLGTTGIETMEILKGMVIDALASRSIDRISSTIQISDTGIVPGAGVGNTRKEISQSTLGIPVIAIGVPTVVELATLVSDGIDIFIDRLQQKAESNDYLNRLQQDDKYEEVKEALNVGEYNMIVTPKEIDDLIENMKDVVTRGINFAV